MRRFEWDERKRLANIAKHGVDFAVALLMFESYVISRVDDRFDYGEVRFISLGVIEDECFVVVHTERDDATRLISAWKGGHDEQIFYHEGLSRRRPGHEGEG